MLCTACEEIFSRPRKLAYGSIHPWKQTPQSFHLAKEEGCHLCHLIEASRGYDSSKRDDFPKSVNYAFKPLNPNWARSGQGTKWYAFQSRGGTEDDPLELEEYLEGVQTDPTPNGLAQLLATDAPNLPEEAAKSWMVLQFYGNEDIVLPVELASPGEKIEQLAHKSLELQTSTGQAETLELAKEWLHNCLNTHKECGQRHPSSSEHFLPTRLIDVGTTTTPLLRLVTGASVKPSSQYVALSHRWGSNQAHILRLSNVEAYTTAGIPTSDTSPTVRDAAHITRALGIRYLWVDCMCIIQDDGGADWARESNSMFKVYSLSTCTIAAAAALDGDHSGGSSEKGFLRTRSPLRVRPLWTTSPFSSSCEYSFHIHPPTLSRLHDTHVRSSEWFKRGWVFQERMLAPRLLIFTDEQILWGCPGLQAAESWPKGKTGENFIDRFTSVEVETARMYALLDQETGIKKSHKAWWEFLQDYMASELTFRSDRLPAIRGVAALVEELTGEIYCSGFWITSEDLPRALLWEPRKGRYAWPTHLVEYRAPSFSWAAVEGGVQFDHMNSESAESFIRAIEGVVLPSQGRGANAAAGRNPREALKLEGMLLPASVLTLWGGEEPSYRILTREEGAEEARPIRRLIVFLKHLLGRTRIRVKNRVSRFLHGLLRCIRRIWDPWLLYTLCILGFPVVVALALAALGITIGLVVAGAALALVVVPLYYLIKFCNHYWFTRLYPYFFALQIEKDEIKQAQEMKAHEEDMLRRQRKAEERAAKVFADLEKGVKFEDPVAVSKRGQIRGEDTSVRIYLQSDYPLSERQVLDVYVLPTVRCNGTVSGLVVKMVGGGTAHQYERLGIFRAGSDDLFVLLPGPTSPREFLLV